MKIINPATEEVITEVTEDTQEITRRKIQAIAIRPEAMGIRCSSKKNWMHRTVLSIAG